MKITSKNEKEIYKNPNTWVKDGVDHINISSYGLTELGQVLKPTSYLSFNHHLLGEFDSVSCFWSYIETGCVSERVRTMLNPDRLLFLKSAVRHDVKNLLYIILDAMWQRVSQYKLLSETLSETSVPFDSYNLSNFTNVAVRNNCSVFIFKGYEEIRAAIKENKTPSFDGMRKGLSREEIFETFQEDLKQFKNKGVFKLHEPQTFKTKENILLSKLKKQN